MESEHEQSAFDGSPLTAPGQSRPLPPTRGPLGSRGCPCSALAVAPSFVSPVPIGVPATSREGVTPRPRGHLGSPSLHCAHLLLGLGSWAAIRNMRVKAGAVRVHASTLCPGSPACPLKGVARPQGLPQRPLLHRPQAAPAQMPGSRGPGGPGLPSPPGQKPRLPPFRSGARGSPTPKGTEGHQLRTAPGGTGGSGSWVSSPRVAPGGSGSGPALQGQSNGNLLGLFLGK